MMAEEEEGEGGREGRVLLDVTPAVVRHFASSSSFLLLLLPTNQTQAAETEEADNLFASSSTSTSSILPSSPSTYLLLLSTQGACGLLLRSLDASLRQALSLLDRFPPSLPPSLPSSSLSILSGAYLWTFSLSSSSFTPSSLPLSSSPSSSSKGMMTRLATIDGQMLALPPSLPPSLPHQKEKGKQTCSESRLPLVR